MVTLAALQQSPFLAATTADLIRVDQATQPLLGATPKQLVSFPALKVEELSWGQALTCALSSTCALTERPDSSTATADTSFKDSAAVAASVAAQHGPYQQLTVSRSDISGPSAGLALTLAMLESPDTGMWSFGEGVVAATGEILPGGGVGPVGGVDVKVRAALEQDVAVLFVPRGQAPDSGDGKVIEVDSVDDAVDWLCRHGATHTLCSPNQ